MHAMLSQDLFHWWLQIFVTYIVVTTNVFSFVTRWPHNFSPGAPIAIKGCLEDISSDLVDVDGLFPATWLTWSPSLSVKSPKIASKQAFMATSTTRENLCGHPVTKKNICGHNDISYKKVVTTNKMKLFDT